MNIATGVAISVNDVADTLLQLLGRTGMKPIHTEPRPGDVREAYADISTAKEILGYNPKVSLKEGIDSLLGDVLPPAAGRRGKPACTLPG